MTEVLVLGLLFALIAIGVPIAVAILAAALVGVFALRGVFGFYNAALAIFDGAQSFPLIAIPLFILAGALMNTGGISRRLIAFVTALIGFVRGGLAMVNVGVSLFFAVLLASVNGAMVPMVFERLGIDPAVASGPLVTTSNDITGIIIYFSLAAWLIEYLLR